MVAGGGPPLYRIGLDWIESYRIVHGYGMGGREREREGSRERERGEHAASMLHQFGAQHILHDKFLFSYFSDY